MVGRRSARLRGAGGVVVVVVGGGWAGTAAAGVGVGKVAGVGAAGRSVCGRVNRAAARLVAATAALRRACA